MADDLARAAQRLRDALALLPASRWDHRAEYDAGIERIKEIIIAEGGRTQAAWSGAAVRMHGLRATSTIGIAGACRNWIAQADRKTAST